MQNKILTSLLSLTLLGCASEFYYENGQKIELVKLEANEAQQKRSDDEVKYYKTAKGHKVGVKDDILVECKEGVKCQEVLSKYEVGSITALNETVFLVKVAKGQNLFELSQKLYEDDDIAIAHPNFRKEKRRR